MSNVSRNVALSNALEKAVSDYQVSGEDSAETVLLDSTIAMIDAYCLFFYLPIMKDRNIPALARALQQAIDNGMTTH